MCKDLAETGPATGTGAAMFPYVPGRLYDFQTMMPETAIRRKIARIAAESPQPLSNGEDLQRIACVSQVGCTGAVCSKTKLATIL